MRVFCTDLYPKYASVDDTYIFLGKKKKKKTHPNWQKKEWKIRSVISKGIKEI